MTAALPRPVLDADPGWLELYDLAWRIAAEHVEHPPAPGWKPQMCCMPGTGIIWLWDSCFMPFFARYGGGVVPVMNNLDNLYRLQRADGFIGMAYETGPETLAYGERINPPLLAWTELHYWRFTGDDSRLRGVFPRLVRFFDWIKANRRRESGLYWFEDSGSTGMDNAPRSGYFARHLDGSDICHVDLAAQQALAAECLAGMARHLGDEATAARFDREHAEITGLLNRFHWNAKTGFYYDVFNRDTPTDRHNVLNHKTVAGFWPLVAGCCDTAQAEALAAHLFDPRVFWTKHPVASLSQDDPNFDPAGAYWLGGVWPPINYMLVKALKRLGRPDLARQLAAAHLTGMSAVHRDSEFPGIWEAYAPAAFLPATKKPDTCGSFPLGPDTVVKADFVGWSGLGPIAMLIEEILGIECDAPAGRISWNIQTPGRHGLERLAFRGGTVDLLCADSAGSARTISVSSTVPFTLCLAVDGVPVSETPLRPGAHSLTLNRPTTCHP
ncbi:MAG TPA: trehalase family glycosidase [Terrimicrobiaceae bacterium]|nr:trehalase family glycosidase [Terrimicrobiaceae bacterium]